MCYRLEFLFDGLENEKPLAIMRHIEGLVADQNIGSFEQKTRRRGLEFGCQRDPDRHELLPVPVKEFFTVWRPDRLNASIGGDLALVTWTGVRAYIDLKLAGLVGAVSDPTAVGRKLRSGFSKTSLQEWLVGPRPRPLD